MAGGVVDRKRQIKCRSKAKTGCATCRIRKVKCDENKPFCKKCVDTGRTCDGYESSFRISTSQTIDNAYCSRIKPDVVLAPLPATCIEIPPQDIELLSRYFSTKTLFNVKVDFDREARQILQASLTDPPVRHAVSSLKALREDLVTSGDDPTSVPQQTPNHRFGVQQYSMALGGLASNLSSSGSKELKLALLCCQIFISIEQVQKNYAAMGQHISRGLRIMHQYRARPHFVATNGLMPAHHDRLPLLDVFIIKLFAAPCKFADPPAAADVTRATMSGYSNSPHEKRVESRGLRTLAPDMRTKLTRIAASTLEFLNKVSQVASVGIAHRLLYEKAALLNSLDSWITDLEAVQTQLESPSHEPLSMSFLRFFHLILKIVISGALSSSLNLHTQLQIDYDQMQALANKIGERARGYITCSGTRSGCGQFFTAR